MLLSTRKHSGRDTSRPCSNSNDNQNNVAACTKRQLRAVWRTPLTFWPHPAARFVCYGSPTCSLWK